MFNLNPKDVKITVDFGNVVKLIEGRIDKLFDEISPSLNAIAKQAETDLIPAIKPAMEQMAKTFADAATELVKVAKQATETATRTSEKHEILMDLMLKDLGYVPPKPDLSAGPEIAELERMFQLE